MVPRLETHQNGRADVPEEIKAVSRKATKVKAKGAKGYLIPPLRLCVFGFAPLREPSLPGRCLLAVRSGYVEPIAEEVE